MTAGPRRAIGRPARLTAALSVGLGLGCTEKILISVGDDVDVDAQDAGTGAGVRDVGAGVRDVGAEVGNPGGNSPGEPRFDVRPGDGYRAESPACAESVRRVPVEWERPSVIIGMDRSTSMTSRWGTGTRLAAAQQALLAMARTYQGAVQFGYEEFPGVRSACGASGGCCASPVILGPGPNHAAALEKAMKCDNPATGCMETGTETPTADALKRCRDFLDGVDGPRYVLLVTDGDPSCTDRGTGNPCDRTLGEVSNLAGKGIKTIVLGLSGSAKATTCLERMAQTGGANRMGIPSYYPAYDDKELQQSLTEIIGGLAARACRLTARSPIGSPDRIVVSLDGKAVPHDPTRVDGWSYEATPGSMRIVVSGSWCEKIKTSQVAEVEVMARCSLCAGPAMCR